MDTRFLKPSMDALDPRKPVDYTDPKISGLPAPVQNPGTTDTQHSPAAWHAPKSLEGTYPGAKTRAVQPSWGGDHTLGQVPTPNRIMRRACWMTCTCPSLTLSTGGGENLLPNRPENTGRIPAAAGGTPDGQPAEAPHLHIPQNQLQPDG